MSYLNTIMRKQRLREQIARLEAEIESLEREEITQSFPDNWQTKGILSLTGNPSDPVLRITEKDTTNHYITYNLGELIRSQFFGISFSRDYVEQIKMFGYKLGNVLITVNKIDEVEINE